MENPNDLYQERSFLHDIGTSLNAALFIVDRLTEELREEEGRLENDPEMTRLYQHLANYLVKVDSLIKNRHTYSSELLQKQMTVARNPETDSPASSRH